jgi:hypothetical protein
MKEEIVVTENIKLQILEANYWEHYKHAKDLSFIFPIDHPKRLLLESNLNNMIEQINKLKS